MPKAQRRKARLNPIPPKLKALVEKINWLPAWFEMEPPYSTPAKDVAPSGDRHSALYKQINGLRVEGKKLAQENKAHRRRPERDIDEIEKRVARFIGYVLGGMILKEDFASQAALSNFDYLSYVHSLQEAESRYASFYYTRMQLRTLLRMKKEIETLSIYRPANPIRFFIEKGKAHTRLLRFQVEPDELLDALNGIEIDRLRECEVCERIFWAARKDMKCCPRPRSCGNVYRQRLIRKKQT